MLWRSSFVIVIVALTLALAGPAGAEKPEKDKAHPGADPKGKHAEAAPPVAIPPPLVVDAPPIEPEPAAPRPAAPPAPHVAAAPVAVDERAPLAEHDEAAPDDAPVPTPAPSARPRGLDRIDELLGADTRAFSAAPATLALGMGSAAFPSMAEDRTGPWAVLRWALPLAGLGGLGAVLLARKRRAHDDAPHETMAPRAGASPSLLRLHMAPVSPDDVPGLLRNGHAAAAREAYAEAIVWFERALAAAPGLAVALFCRGVCLAATGRAVEAYGALREAIDADPSDATSRVHFARVALAVGLTKEAMDALDIVVRAMPEHGPAMMDDPQLAALRDHPRFLMICGAL